MMEIDQTGNTSSKEELEAKLKKLIQLYFFQLTKGCGRKNCTNPHCCSNPKNKPLPPSEAVPQSFVLAQKGDIALCSNFPADSAPMQVETTIPSPSHAPAPKPVPAPTPAPAPVDKLTAQEFINMAQEALQTQNFTPLIRKIGIVFSTSESLNASFLKQDDQQDDAAFGLDIQAIRDIYKMVTEKLPPNVGNALVGANERLLPNLKRMLSQLTTPQSLRQFIIMLENPLLDDHNNHKTVLLPLAVCMVNLPEKSLELLKRWFGTFTKPQFQSLLARFQQYISLKIMLPPMVPSVNSDDGIIAVTRLLKILHQVNESRGQLVSYTEFYNDLINENIDLRDDFVNWKTERGFSFCNYPFILDPAVKSKMLQIESAIQMRQQREEAFRQLFFGQGSTIPILGLRIRREHLIEDSLSELSRYPTEDLKKELKVYMVGEEAIDEGGVQKEWFQLIIKEIFHEKYGMFALNKDSRRYWFNKNSMEAANEFQLIGIMLGLAIYNGVILDIHFPHYLYKKLMNPNEPPTLSDLKEWDPSLGSGLEKLLNFNGDVEEVFSLTFQVEYTFFDEKRTHLLKEGGDKISVTNENKKEYVDLYLRYVMDTSVRSQFDAFYKGFKLLCDSPGFELFRWEELELLICGSPNLDFEALEKSTQYEGFSGKDDPYVKMFWEIVHSFTPEQKRRLLFFATGSDRSPIGGLGKLGFVISKHGGDSDRLPSAHTCFNHLLLPQYSSRDKLQERLVTAINNAEGFGML